MKKETKKKIAGWAVGTLFTGILLAAVQMGLQVGITSFPALIDTCRWLISWVMARIGN